MAQQSFMSILMGFLIFTLFIGMILTFSDGLAGNYGTDIEEMSGGAYSLDQYYESISGTEEDAEAFRKRFESGDIEDVDDATGIFSIMNDMKSMVFDSITLLNQTLSNVLGVPAIVISILVVVAIALMWIFLPWRNVKLGY